MQNDRDFKFSGRASAYDEGFEGNFSKRFYRLLLRCVELSEGKTVLDVGCGTGTVLKKMSENSRIDGYGIDIEQNMIAEAKRKCPEMNISVSSCADTPFESDKFDVVTACMAYHHFGDKKGFAKEAGRIIKAGGCLYITDPRFPWIIRKPLNFALRIHKVAGYFGTPKEIESVFREYGFSLDEVSYDKYAQCVKLKKAG